MVLKAWRLSRRVVDSHEQGRCGSRQHTAEAMWMRTLHRLRISFQVYILNRVMMLIRE